jgi:asparagine synthase (glutamine-hydrolysing)
MCGINAIYAFHPSAPTVNLDELTTCREAMHSRGPDAAGMWTSTDLRVGLGHRRLSIIDVSERANQPMLSREGDLAIIFNGEIYNYRQLRDELASAGETFDTTSDTEVVLRMYRRNGAAMLPRLRGMFAFAIWDGRTRTLFLARDPYGIKPLYYANDGRTFRVASQVKALLAEHLTAHYQAWPKMKLPALDGKTPLQAMKSPEGREMVEALLLDMEQRSKAGPGLDREILAELRATLGAPAQ